MRQMRAQDLTADLTQSAFDSYLRTFSAMPDDRRDWAPQPGTRSALNMLWEIAAVNELFADFLTGKTDQPLTFAGLGKIWLGECPHSSDELLDLARSATSRLCDAIRAIPDEQLEEMVQVNPEAQLPKKMLMWMGLRNLWYHFGQANYIQSFYGDRDMH